MVFIILYPDEKCNIWTRINGLLYGFHVKGRVNYMDEISLQRKKSGIYISMEAAEEAELELCGSTDPLTIPKTVP